jgi:hypothetical protein
MNERVMDTWEIEIRVEEEVMSVLPWSSGFGLVSSSLVPWSTYGDRLQACNFPEDPVMVYVQRFPSWHAGGGPV